MSSDTGGRARRRPESRERPRPGRRVRRRGGEDRTDPGGGADESTAVPPPTSDEHDHANLVARAERALDSPPMRLAAVLLGSMATFVGWLVVARVLGPDRFGELSLVHGVVIITIAATILVTTDAMGRVAGAATPQPRRSWTSLIGWLRIQLAVGLLLVAAVTGVFAVMSGAEQAAIALAFGLGEIAIWAGRVTESHLDQTGDRRTVTTATLASAALALILVAGLLGAGIELLALPMAVVGSGLVRTVWLWRSAHAQIDPQPRAFDPRGAQGRRDLVSIRRPARDATMALTGPIVTSAVVVAVAVVVTTETAGLVAAAEVGIVVPTLLVLLIGRRALAAALSRKMRGSRLLWWRVGRMADALSVPIVAASIVLYGFADQVVEFAFGTPYADASLAFGVLALSLPASCLIQILGAASAVDGRMRQHSLASGAGAVLVIGLAVSAIIVNRSSSPLAVAAWAAGAVTVGRWATAVALLKIRPLPNPRRATSGILIVLAATLSGLATFGTSRSGPIWYSLCAVAGLVLVASLPRSIRDLRATRRSAELEQASPSARLDEGAGAARRRHVTRDAGVTRAAPRLRRSQQSPRPDRRVDSGNRISDIERHRAPTNDRPTRARAGGASGQRAGGASGQRSVEIADDGGRSETVDHRLHAPTDDTRADDPGTDEIARRRACDLADEIVDRAIASLVGGPDATDHPADHW